MFMYMYTLINHTSAPYISFYLLVKNNGIAQIQWKKQQVKKMLCQKTILNGIDVHEHEK